MSQELFNFILFDVGISVLHKVEEWIVTWREILCMEEVFKKLGGGDDGTECLAYI